MKSASPPVLTLSAFPPTPTPYYVEQLQRHVARFPHVNMPHAHSFYLLLLISKGSGTHTVDLMTYELKPGSLFFMAPGQVHQWQLTADTDGFVVFFESDFYQLRYPYRDMLTLPYFDSRHPPVLYLPLANELTPLFEQLYNEFHTHFVNQAEVVHSYLSLVLELAMRLCPSPPIITKASLAQSQIRQFGALLNQHYRTHRGVHDYAERLHLTTNYLNALCQRVLGQTASAIIQARVVLEAQRLLVYSALSVAQVAHELAFGDPSYFARYFRKHVGMSPEAFRQQQ